MAASKENAEPTPAPWEAQLDEVFNRFKDNFDNRVKAMVERMNETFERFFERMDERDRRFSNRLDQLLEAATGQQPENSHPPHPQISSNPKFQGTGLNPPVVS